MASAYKIDISGTEPVVTEVEALPSITGALTDFFSTETAHAGMVPMITRLGVVYGAAVAVNYTLTGKFHANPLSDV